jgi:hypothetical protein
MTLESWYYLAGISSFFVAVGGLIGLAFYAFDTHELRTASEKQLKAAMKQVEAIQQQLESAITPCVLVLENRSNGEVDAPLRLTNCGPGVALNISLRYSGDEAQQWTEFPALGPGETTDAQFRTRDVIDRGAVECRFESISGTPYSTLSGFSENTTNLNYRHQFKRLARDL